MKAGYGPTIRADAVKKLVDSVVTFQERSLQIVQEMRTLATKNSAEIRDAVEDGKRRIARFVAEGRPLPAQWLTRPPRDDLGPPAPAAASGSPRPRRRSTTSCWRWTSSTPCATTRTSWCASSTSRAAKQSSSTACARSTAAKALRCLTRCCTRACARSRKAASSTRRLRPGWRTTLAHWWVRRAEDRQGGSCRRRRCCARMGRL